MSSAFYSKRVRDDSIELTKEKTSILKGLTYDLTKESYLSIKYLHKKRGSV